MTSVTHIVDLLASVQKVDFFKCLNVVRRLNLSEKWHVINRSEALGNHSSVVKRFVIISKEQFFGWAHHSVHKKNVHDKDNNPSPLGETKVRPSLAFAHFRPVRKGRSFPTLCYVGVHLQIDDFAFRTFLCWAFVTREAVLN